MSAPAETVGFPSRLAANIERELYDDLGHKLCRHQYASERFEIDEEHPDELIIIRESDGKRFCVDLMVTIEELDD